MDFHGIPWRYFTRGVLSDSSVCDYCRLCAISFKVKVGSNLRNQGHSSSENLFRPSKRKECFGVVSKEIWKEVVLPFVHFMQYSDRVCNPCGWKIRNLGQFYRFIKAVITATARTPVKSTKHTLDTSDKASPAWRKLKSVRVNSRAAKSPSIEGSTSATKGKSRKSLFFSLLEKIRKPKSLIYLILTSKEVKENAFANKINELGPVWYNIAGKHIHSRTRRKSLCYSDPETLWTKIKDLKALFVEPQERALRFERGQRKCPCIRGQIMPTRNSKTTGNQ